MRLITAATVTAIVARAFGVFETNILTALATFDRLSAVVDDAWPTLTGTRYGFRVRSTARFAFDRLSAVIDDAWPTLTGTRYG